MSEPNDLHIIPEESSNDFIVPQNNSLAFAGHIANGYAAQGVFADYLSCKSDNTIRSQAASLTRFADYLDRIGESIGQSFGAGMTIFAEAVAAFPDGPVPVFLKLEMHPPRCANFPSGAGWIILNKRAAVLKIR